MTTRSLDILQISTFDLSGGAEKVAWDLFRSYRERGYGSWLAVGRKRGDDPDVLQIPRMELHGKWTRFWLGVHSGRRVPEDQKSAGWSVGRVACILAEPERSLDAYCGHEDFRHPNVMQVLQLCPRRPDVVHCHNLHGGYFDLRSLASLSRKLPVVMTLHDEWMLTGHCAYSFDCERWKTGCGDCPHLDTPPAVQRDATAYNLRRKRTIYAGSRLYVATPSQWLMDKVKQSALAPAIAEARVIPYGVDQTVFHPENRLAIRARLGIPADVKLILFTANKARTNPFKDYETLRTATARVAERLPGQNILFIALGDAGPSEQVGLAQIRFVPYQSEPAAVAQYYQAADVYAHAARADNYPVTVLEALACGTPVVATAVGGIPEQIRDGRTGLLAPPADPQAMAARLVEVLSNDILRDSLCAEAAADARRRFNLDVQVDEYLRWYHRLVQPEESVTMEQAA